jgi:hypothetical protein
VCGPALSRRPTASCSHRVSDFCSTLLLRIWAEKNEREGTQRKHIRRGVGIVAVNGRSMLTFPCPSHGQARLNNKTARKCVSNFTTTTATKIMPNSRNSGLSIILYISKTSRLKSTLEQRCSLPAYSFSVTAQLLLF